MLVVLDTNVLVSGLLKENSLPGTIINMIFNEEVQIAVSPKILAEYNEVLFRKKFKLLIAPDAIHGILGFILDKAFVVQDDNLSSYENLVNDSSDIYFIAVADQANASFLVTGNKKDFCEEISSIKIVTPAEFLNII